jgi:hypothetical protein
MLLQGCFQALNLSTHRSIIGRSTTQHMIRTVVLIHLGVISSVAHLPVAHLSFGAAAQKVFVCYEMADFGAGVVLSVSR